jgi:hypothetical protein
LCKVSAPPAVAGGTDIDPGSSRDFEASYPLRTLIKIPRLTFAPWREN